MPAIISQRKIRSVVKVLARRIDRACKAERIQELYVACVMDGSFIFAADLVRAMRTPTRVFFLKASSYRGTRKGATRISALPASLRGQSVLITDTIYDTGITIERVINQVRRQTDSVWLAVLIEKHGKAARAVETIAERAFVGIKLAGDPFLIGYGLDVDGQFRWLPDIQEFSSQSATRNAQ
jgi:hypoxanthine phosphoribosyltransferase